MMRLRAIDWKYPVGGEVNWLLRVKEWYAAFGFHPEHLGSARPGHSIRWEAPR